VGVPGAEQSEPWKTCWSVTEARPLSASVGIVTFTSGALSVCAPSG
jgi:hypothetical protein